jgi:hypothetical protein
MDFFQSQTVPKPLLSYLLPRTFNCTKTTGWFTKGLKWSNLPQQSVTQGSTHSYIHWWTSFSRTNCAQAVILPSSSTFNCTSKTTGWFTKGAEIDRTCPRKKCYQGARILMMWTSFSRAQTVAKPLLSYLLPFSRTFNCTIQNDWLVHQRAEIDQPAPR